MSAAPANNPSTIAVDARMIDHSGIGRYLRGVLPAAIDALSHFQFQLIGPVSLCTDEMFMHRHNVRFSVFDRPVYSLREQMLPRYVTPNATLLWCPHYNIPVAYRGALLVTVHDLCHVDMPRFFPGPKRHIAGLIMRAAVAKADRIACVSEFTRDRLGARYPGARRKSFVAGNGVDETWAAAEPSVAPIARQSDEEADKPYFIYVGNLKPHKNLDALIRAFATAASDVPHDLVLVGQRFANAELSADSQSHLAQLGDRIRFTGKINDPALKALVAAAEAMIFPSLYEGFGLPPLEAMAAGCPVAASDIPPVREVCGDNALYFNPENVTDIAAAIRRLANDPDLRGTLRDGGRVRARAFSWQAAADPLIAAMAEIAESRAGD